MSRVHCLICIILSSLVLVQIQAADEWISKIRSEHPRMFINAEILPLIKSNARGALKDHYAGVKAGSDRLLKRNDIQFHVYECSLPQLMICYYVENDQRYKDKALWVLKTGAEHLGKQFKAKKAVSWFSYARIALMVGYDWLYNDLSPEERSDIATKIMTNVRLMNDKKQKKIGGENYGGFPNGGFYGTNNLKWYAGLAFHGDGHDDEQCITWMKEGIQDYQTLANFRKQSGGDDGGMTAVVLGYVFGAYPRAEWNFIHTWRSAIGENIAHRYSYIANICNWIVWRTIKGHNANYGYGPGDAHHSSNQVNYDNNHLAQIQYFFSESNPQQSQLANYIRQLNTDQKLGGFHFANIYAFLLDWDKMAQTDSKSYGPDSSWAHARHFEFLGQFFMRSGFDKDATYCLFTAGNQGAGHGHYDELNFTIYKKGFLALDTGTRDQTGSRKRTEPCVQHNTEYYNRSIAHNTILIKMPNERFPHHWGNVPTKNDGGQNKQHGSTIRAFSSNEHYSYVNADATAVYNNKKASLVNRQFCYIYPNHFVIVDRVHSTDANYPKTWLLHTQNKPTITDKTLTAIHRGGIMHCKTLWPVDAQQTLIGGPGKTAWVEDENFPITQKYIDKAKKSYKRKHGNLDDFEILTGNWRLEVKPETSATNDLFIHVIEVGDKNELKQMHNASLTENKKSFNVTADLGDGRTAILDFSKNDPVNGSIEIKKGSKRLIKEALSSSIQTQNTVSGN